MEEEIIYINPDCPVYISYARNKNGKDLEFDVNKLCELMEANGILYKRDNAEGDKSQCPYRYNIIEAEEDIGKGDIIVVVLSKNYIESPHCMYEWHCICEAGDIEKRVFPIILPNTMLNEDSRYKSFCRKLEEMLQTLSDKHADDDSSVREIEKKFLENDGYIRDLDKLRKFLEEHNIPDVESLRKNDYSAIIEQIVEHFNSTIEQKYNNLTNYLTKKLLTDNYEKYDLLINNYDIIIRSLEKLKEIVIRHKDLNTKFFNFLCKYIQARTKMQNDKIFTKEIEWLSQPYIYKIEKLLPYDIQLAITMLFKDCRELFAPIQPIFKEEKVDFSCLDLKCSKFSGMEIKNINFSQSMLQYSRIYRYKNIVGLLLDRESQDDKLRESILEDCTFDNAFLDASDMTMATFNNCSFINTNLRWANMFGVKLNNCQFIGCQMTGVILSEAHISDCTFENCKIDAAELMNVHIITNVVMKNCSFCFAYIYSSDIDKNMDKFISCNFDEIEKNPAYYNKGRIKRFLLYQKNIMTNEDVKNNRSIKDKKKTYYATLKEIRDYCLPNSVGLENTEVRFFVEGQYDKIKV